MSVKTIEAVFLRARGITSAERLVLVYLAHRLNDETGECFPTEVRISEDIEIDIRTVKRAIASLEKAGLVSRTVRKTKDGNGRAYAIHVPNEVINSSSSVGGSTPSSDGSVGGTGAGSWWHGRQAVGGVTPPDNKRKKNDSECDSGAAHTQGVVDNFNGGDCSSPFGIYDVEGAVRVLSVGDNPVPRSFIECRAMTLTADGGSLARRTAGLDTARFTFHSWRHTFRTRLAEVGVSDEVARRLGGWTNLKMAAHYDHASHLGEMREAIRRLEG